MGMVAAEPISSGDGGGRSPLMQTVQQQVRLLYVRPSRCIVSKGRPCVPPGDVLEGLSLVYGRFCRSLRKCKSEIHIFSSFPLNSTSTNKLLDKECLLNTVFRSNELAVQSSSQAIQRPPQRLGCLSGPNLLIHIFIFHSSNLTDYFHCRNSPPRCSSPSQAYSC